jgi:hypothetical protein
MNRMHSTGMSQAAPQFFSNPDAGIQSSQLLTREQTIVKSRLEEENEIKMRM